MTLASNEAATAIPARWSRPKIGRDRHAITLVAAMVVVASAWNASVGLSWSTPLAPKLAIPAACLLYALYYRIFRPREFYIPDFMLYAALWILFALFGAKMTYLAATLNFPEQDGLLQSIDSALGFQWLAWDAWIARHPWLHESLRVAYGSIGWQPFLSIPLLSFLGPRGRNAEFLAAGLIGLVITTIIATFIPATGPSFVPGAHSELDKVLTALHSRSHVPLPYMGIVTFPSYHTVLAILFVYAHRGIRWTFPFFALLNFFMLLSTPTFGNHYLVDMLGGTAVAVVTIALVRWQREVLTGVPAKAGPLVPPY